MASNRAKTPEQRRSRSDSVLSTDSVSAVESEQASAGATKGLTAEQTKKAESRLSKMITRSVYGLAMIFTFSVLTWLGHPYLVFLVVMLQFGLFRELVNVHYEPAKEKHVPLFRTIQWSMFMVAMQYMYGKVFVKLGLARSLMRQLPAWLAPYVNAAIRYRSIITFTAYVTVFVTFVLTLKKGLYQYQIKNVVWTVAILCLVVYQVRGTAELIFGGLFWFLLPCSLVIFNDIAAYFCGQLMGKRFISAPFLSLSPNKTWEGFIGAFFCTLVYGWYFSDWTSRYDWFVCPQLDLETYGSLDCEPAAHFVVQNLVLPYEDFRLLTLEAKPVQLHALCLACFASLIAPVGGFLASGIKRAYNIKDFDSFIPGHGGVMDRMDCQLLMLLCTYVHVKSFVPQYELDEEQLFSMITTLPMQSQQRILQRLTEALAS